PGCLEELAGEALAGDAAKHAAGTEVDEVAVAVRAIAGEGLAELLAGDAAEDGRHRRWPAVEGEVIERGVEQLLLPPHHAAGPGEVVGDALRRFDETVRDR